MTPDEARTRWYNAQFHLSRARDYLEWVEDNGDLNAILLAADTVNLWEAEAAGCLRAYMEAVA